MSISNVQKALGKYERVLNQASTAIKQATTTNKGKDIAAAKEAFSTFFDSQAVIEQVRGTAQKTDKKTKAQFAALEERANALTNEYLTFLTKEASPKAKKAEEKAKGTFDKTPKGKKKAGKEDKKIDPKRVVDFSKEMGKCERLLESHFAATNKVAQTRADKDAEALDKSLGEQEDYSELLARLEKHAGKADKATHQKLSELRQRANVLSANLLAIAAKSYDDIQADPKIKVAFDKAAKGAKTDKTKAKPLSEKTVKKVKKPENKGKPAQGKDLVRVYLKQVKNIVPAAAELGDAIESKKDEETVSKARQALKTACNALPKTIQDKLFKNRLDAATITYDKLLEFMCNMGEPLKRNQLAILMLAIDENDKKLVKQKIKEFPSKMERELTDALTALKKDKDKEIAQGAKQALKGKFHGPALKKALKQMQKSFDTNIDTTFKQIDRCVQAITVANTQSGLSEDVKDGLIIEAYKKFLEKTNPLWRSEDVTLLPRLHDAETPAQWLNRMWRQDPNFDPMGSLGMIDIRLHLAKKAAKSAEKVKKSGDKKKADGKKDSKKVDDKKKADSKKDSKKADDKKKAGSKKDSKKADDKKKAGSKKDSKKADDKKKAGSKKDSKKADDKKKAGGKKDSKKAGDKKKADGKKDSKKADHKKRK